MRYDIHDIEDLIHELGGPTAIGEWLGISQEAVSNWKARQSIPSGWHLRLAGALLRRGKAVHPGVFGLHEDDVPFLRVGA